MRPAEPAYEAGTQRRKGRLNDGSPQLQQGEAHILLHEYLPLQQLLDAVLEAVEASRGMLNSPDENVRGFAVEMIESLSEKAMMLMNFLMKRSGEGNENPLARRARLEDRG